MARTLFGFFGAPWDSTGGGPTTYNETLTETAATGDAQSAVAVWASSLSETAGANDSGASAVAWASSLAETTSAGDASAAVATWASSLTESVAAGDSGSAAATFQATHLESAAAGDSGSASAVFESARSESAAVADGIAAVAVWASLLLESLAAADSASATGGGGAGADPAAVWAYELAPGVTAGDMLLALYTSLPTAAAIVAAMEASGTKLEEIHRIHGLLAASPLVVTPTTRTAGSISQGIAGDGTTSTTVTRT